MRPVSVLIDLSQFQAEDGNYLQQRLPDGDTPQAVHQLLHELRLARDRIREDIGRVLHRNVATIGRVTSELEKAKAERFPETGSVLNSKSIAHGEVKSAPGRVEPHQLELEDEVRGRMGRGEWEEAILLLDRLRDDRLGQEMAGLLLKVVRQPLIDKPGLVKAAQWLTLLQRGELAREEFLQSRSRAIREAHCLVQYAGRVSGIINDLSFVTMHHLHTTAEWYRAAFGEDPTLMACLVTWAQLELGKLVTLVSKLLFQEQRAKPFQEQRAKPLQEQRAELSESISLMRSQIAQLSAMGLSLQVAMDDLIQQHLERLISQHTFQLIQQLE